MNPILSSIYISFYVRKYLNSFVLLSLKVSRGFKPRDFVNPSDNQKGNQDEIFVEPQWMVFL